MTLDIHDTSAPSSVHPEWVPLDEAAQAWAAFSLQVTSALALQAVGSAFLALSFETSAHTSYTHAHHPLWQWVPQARAGDLDQACTDLLEACHQWTCAFGWLERFANEERHQEETLVTIRALFGQVHQQQQRLGLLWSRLQEERRARYGELLARHQGALASATAEPEENLTVFKNVFKCIHFEPMS